MVHYILLIIMNLITTCIRHHDNYFWLFLRTCYYYLRLLPYADWNDCLRVVAAAVGLEGPTVIVVAANTSSSLPLPADRGPMVVRSAAISAQIKREEYYEWYYYTVNLTIT